MADKPRFGCATSFWLLVAVSIPAGLIQAGGAAMVVGVLMYAAEAALLLSFLTGFGRGIANQLRPKQTPPAPRNLTPEQREAMIRRNQPWKRD